MFILKIATKTSPQKETEFFQALESAFKKAERFTDVKTRISRDVYENCLFHIELSWKNESDLKNYMNSNDYQYLVGALTVLGDITEQKIISANKIDQVN
jgi:hypothetical protein